MTERWELIFSANARAGVLTQQMNEFDATTFTARLGELKRRLLASRGEPAGYVGVTDPAQVRRRWRHDRLSCEYVVSERTERTFKTFWRKQVIHVIEIVFVYVVPYPGR